MGADHQLYTNVSYDGLSKEIGTNQEFNFAAGYALNNSVEGPNAFDPGQTIKIEMSQIDIQAGWAWKF